MKINSFFYYLIILFCCITALKAEENIKNEDFTGDCGPQCVKYLSRYFNCPVTLYDACELCGVDVNEIESLISDRIKDVNSIDEFSMSDIVQDTNDLDIENINMLNLKQALLKLDLYCFGFRGSVKYLKQKAFKDCAFIVALEEMHHFIIIAKALKSDDWLWIDPSTSRVSLLGKNYFKKKDSYAYLAVSDIPISVDLIKAETGFGFMWIYLTIIPLVILYIIFKSIHNRTVRNLKKKTRKIKC